jgi:hypothetical protein
MRSCVSLLSFVLLAGCGSKGCGSSASSASASPAPAPAPTAPRPAAAEPPEARFAKKYLVIVHSSPTPGEAQELVEKLRAANLGADVQRLSSTPYSSLRPCLEVVVAGAFVDKDAALALSGRLDGAGVKNYLKNAGALAQDRERREAACREQAEAQAALAARTSTAADPRFVDLRGPRTFVLLTSEAQDTPGSELRQQGGDRGFWMAALPKDPTGTFKLKDTFDVYDKDGLVKSGCRVKGFASLNRGVPHFGYFQQAEEPDQPGCGNTWPVAELDCSFVGTRALSQDTPVFALPAGRPAPRYFPLRSDVPEPLKASQEEALKAMPEFAQTREQGEAHAREQGLPLEESLVMTSASVGNRRVVVSMARFLTGEGHAACGGPDFWATVSLVRAVGEDGQETSMGHLVDGESLVTVMDLEGDGSLELLTRDPADPQRMAIVREDGTQVAGSFLPNCDCGC